MVAEVGLGFGILAFLTESLVPVLAPVVVAMMGHGHGMLSPCMLLPSWFPNDSIQGGCGGPRFAIVWHSVYTCVPLIMSIGVAEVGCRHVKVWSLALLSIVHAIPFLTSRSGIEVKHEMTLSVLY